MVERHFNFFDDVVREAVRNAPHSDHATFVFWLQSVTDLDIAFVNPDTGYHFKISFRSEEEAVQFRLTWF